MVDLQLRGTFTHIALEKGIKPRCETAQLVPRVSAHIDLSKRHVVSENDVVVLLKRLELGSGHDILDTTMV